MKINEVISVGPFALPEIKKLFFSYNFINILFPDDAKLNTCYLAKCRKKKLDCEGITYQIFTKIGKNYQNDQIFVIK